MASNLAPTQNEFSDALGSAQMQIVGVGGSQKSSSTVLKFAFRTGGTEIVWLDETGIQHLVAVLKTIVPKFEGIDRLSVSVNLESDMISASSPSGNETR
jgi:hypothetical protein